MEQTAECVRDIQTVIFQTETQTETQRLFHGQKWAIPSLCDYQLSR